MSTHAGVRNTVPFTNAKTLLSPALQWRGRERFQWMFSLYHLNTNFLLSWSASPILQRHCFSCFLVSLDSATEITCTSAVFRTYLGNWVKGPGRSWSSCLKEVTRFYAKSKVAASSIHLLFNNQSAGLQLINQHSISVHAFSRNILLLSFF